MHQFPPTHLFVTYFGIGEYGATLAGVNKNTTQVYIHVGMECTCRSCLHSTEEDKVKANHEIICHESCTINSPVRPVVDLLANEQWF